MRAGSFHDAARGGQAGQALVEVMVSAAILLVAVVSLFLALDVQTSASSDARGSSTAANLAEQDQERLRSFAVPDLSNRHEIRTVTVAGENYNVDSRVDWISDATGGAQSCASSSTQADYLRLTTTVTAPSEGATPPAPIVLRSLVAPPVGQFGVNQGTLVVQTNGGAGQPIQGVTTSITGPTSLSDTSNALGCAVFAYVPVGTYTVSDSAPGFVDPAGNANATGPGNVTQGTAYLTPLLYDRSGVVNVSFDTKVGSAAAQPSTSTVITAANSGVPTTGKRTFTQSTPQGTIFATALFPFSSAYTIYSGTCAAANPAMWVPTYFTSGPGSVVVVGGTTTSVTVREPALQLAVTTTAASTPVTVRVKSVDSGCTDAYTFNLTTNASKTVSLPDPGFPWGNYSVCASTTGTGAVRKSGTNVALTTAAGMASVQTVALSSGTTAGTCP